MIKLLQKTIICSALLFTAQLAVADDDCIKPKVTGYSQDEMSCIGDGLVSVWNDNGPSVLDRNGKTIIPSGRYNYIFFAQNGLVGVGKDTDTYAMVGFVSQSTGREVIPLKYVSTGHYDIGVNQFYDGLVAMKTPSEKWGYLDTKGKTVIPFIYDSAEDFSEGLAVVSKGPYDNAKYGYINKQGKTVIPLSFDYASSFSEGLATVRKGSQETGKYGVIDKTGKLVIPYKFEGYIDSFSEGLAGVVNSQSKLGYIDRTGKLVIPYQYNGEPMGDSEGYPSFHNGKAYVMDYNNNEICINKTGKKVSC